MTIPTVTVCDVKIQQVSQIGQTVLCDIYLNDELKWKGIQNANYPIPLGRYRSLPFKGQHPHTRLILTGIQHHAGVEIHEANHASELKGCTAIGEIIKGDILLNSIEALSELITVVEKYNVCYVTLSCKLGFTPYTVQV
jgi:hypothetical protein